MSLRYTNHMLHLLECCDPSKMKDENIIIFFSRFQFEFVIKTSLLRCFSLHRMEVLHTEIKISLWFSQDNTTNLNEVYFCSFCRGLNEKEKTYNNWRMKESGTNPVHAIFKIILSLHILLWRPEIRPRIALRLRANLVLLGRRRWKRFLEYWEGKTLENYFCAGRECCGLSKILLHRDFDQVDFVQMHFMHETSFLL